MRIRAIPCRQRILHGAGALAVETAVGFLMLSRDARRDRPALGQGIRLFGRSGTFHSGVGSGRPVPASTHTGLSCPGLSETARRFDRPVASRFRSAGARSARMKRVRSMSCSQIAEAVGERTEPPYRGGEARSRCSQGRTVRLWTRRLRPSRVKFRPAVQQNPVFCVIFAKYGDCPLM